MTIDVNTELLKKTDLIGVIIFSFIAHLEQGSFGVRVTQAEIADTLHVAKSTVSVRINELKSLGLLEYSNKYKRYFITANNKNI